MATCHRPRTPFDGWVHARRPGPARHPSARALPGLVSGFPLDRGFPSRTGGALPGLTLRYETYGTLLPDKSNAVLVPHALSGDHHVAGKYQPDDVKAGWWDVFVGPGKAIDTNRFFVIGVNCIGGCKGSTGPSSLDPRTGHRFGGYFPEITLGDIVRGQRMVIRHLGITKLHAVVGGSMGGMQALLWCADYPQEVGRIAVLAAGLSQSPMAIALNAVSRACVEKDPNFRGGHYAPGEGPDTGLSIGRMLAHISYLSSSAFDQKFGRAKVPGAKVGDPVHWQVESYLDHQGAAFVKRFDANSWLRITRAVDRFDLTARAAAGTLFQGMGRTSSPSASRATGSTRPANCACCSPRPRPWASTRPTMRSSPTRGTMASCCPTRG